MRAFPGPATAVRGALALALGVLASCSHPQPAPAPEPAPTPPAAHGALPPTAAAGTFDLTAVIQGRTIPAPPAAPPRRGRPRTLPVPATLQLTPTPAAAPDPAAPSSTQLVAAVSLPGYTLPPRGRTVQTAAWWPGAGDSIIVRWVIAQRNAAVSLRGTLRGDSIGGDVWYTMLDSGSEFQLGTFSAVRKRPAR
jgi:hypothetical protein